MSSFGYSKAVQHLHRNINACGVQLESTGLHSWFPKPKTFSLKHLVTKDASLGTGSGSSLAGRPPPQPITTRRAGEVGEWADRASGLGRWHSGA